MREATPRSRNVPRESKVALTRRAKRITTVLKKRYPNARTALNYSTPLELLVATILSAQCTDVRVNLITANLFKKYKAPSDYANADQDVLAEEIRTAGFFRNKAKNIRAACAKIVEEFGGNVPGDMKDLLTLPGVARKTANVVLGDVFNKQEGIAVDTHVIRLSGRLRLTTQKDNQGDRIENDLMAIVPQKDWTIFSHLLIYHGRETCTARTADCPNCPVSDLCPSAFKI
jgi:endonuclease-3